MPEISDEIYKMIIDNLHITYTPDESTQRRLKMRSPTVFILSGSTAIRKRIVLPELSSRVCFAIMYFARNPGQKKHSHRILRKI